MKRLILTLALFLLPSLASAQCNGVFDAHTVCGNSTGSPGIPGMIPQSAVTGIPGGSNPQIQYNNAGAFGGLTDAQVMARVLPGWVSPKQYGAVCDGSTNDSTAFSSAVTALGVNGGTLALPAGVCCLSTGVTVSAAVRILGAGTLASQLSACGANTSVVIMNARRAALEHVAVLGTDALNAAHPTIDLQPGCVECLVNDVYASFGNSVLTLSTSDMVIQDVYAAYAYGTAVVVNTGGGSWFIRDKFDQDWPTGTPPSGLTTTVPAWAATTAYILNQVVTTGGYVLQCTKAGTSGGGAPTVAKYFTTIIDGSAEWKMALPSTYYGMFISGAGSQNTLTLVDFTGSFLDSIHVSGTIFSLKINQSSFGQFLSFAVATDAAGATLYFTSNEVVGGILQSVGGGISLGPTWKGPNSIVGNTFIGNFFGTSKYGISLSGASNNTAITSNSITGFNTGIIIAADIGNFIISNNFLGSSNGAGTNTNSVVVSAGASDFYMITNNIVDGVAISDGGTGTHKNVTPNQ